MGEAKTFQEALNLLTQSYSNLNKTQPSSWVYHINNRWFYCIRAICHAEMANNSCGTKEFITAAPVTQHPASLDYYRWLISGPFRAFSDTIFLEQNPTDREWYIRITELNRWPANVLYNFCISTRVPIEYIPRLDRWQMFRSIDMNDSLAFILACHTTDDYQIKANFWDTVFVPKPFISSGHFWLDNGFDWDQLMSGVMNKEKFRSSYYDKPNNCREANIIWGSGTYHGPSDQTPRQLSDKFNLKMTNAAIDFGKLPQPIIEEEEEDEDEDDWDLEWVDEDDEDDGDL